MEEQLKLENQICFPTLFGFQTHHQGIQTVPGETGSNLSAVFGVTRIMGR